MYAIRSYYEYVAFDGGGEAVTQLLAGSVQAFTGDVSEAKGFVDSGDIVPAGEVTPISPAETAELLKDAKSVIIVPGYGMAVAQAQHKINVITSYSIHYTKLYDSTLACR